jgi:endo-1,4-beta-D-glucanase Y
MIADETNDTVSEGIAYGLLIAVYMNEQELFDRLWRYEQRFLDAQGLMHWHINAAGTMVVGEGAASDADEDMAWAMLMADRQWGGGGTLGTNYIDIARDLIDKMWNHEVLDGKAFLPGDQFGDWQTLNISYFTPNYFRLFGEISGNGGWNDVVVTSYDVMEASLKPEYGNQDNGLVPAWSTSEGSPNAGAWGPYSEAPTHHQYDSCRTPFRIGLDYCFNGEARSKSYLDKIIGFYSSLGVDGMTDGYNLDGTPRPQFGGLSAAFVGPAAVGAMSDSTHQGFLDAAYDRLKTSELLVGGEYYDRSWTVLALLMLTGNFLDYTKIEPQ